MPNATPPPSLARIIVDDAIKPCLVLGVAVLLVLTLALATFPSPRAPMIEAPEWSAP